MPITWADVRNAFKLSHPKLAKYMGIKFNWDAAHDMVMDEIRLENGKEVLYFYHECKPSETGEPRSYAYMTIQFPTCGHRIYEAVIPTYKGHHGHIFCRRCHGALRQSYISESRQCSDCTPGLKDIRLLTDSHGDHVVHLDPMSMPPGKYWNLKRNVEDTVYRVEWETLVRRAEEHQIPEDLQYIAIHGR